jgi:hypothetical protein
VKRPCTRPNVLSRRADNRPDDAGNRHRATQSGTGELRRIRLQERGNQRDALLAPVDRLEHAAQVAVRLPAPEDLKGLT